MGWKTLEWEGLWVFPAKEQVAGDDLHRRLGPFLQPLEVVQGEEHGV